MSQAPDNQPGNYYVSVIDGKRVGRLLGPFENDHAGALAMVDKVRVKAEELDPALPSTRSARSPCPTMTACRSGRVFSTNTLDFHHEQASLS